MELMRSRLGKSKSAVFILGEGSALFGVLGRGQGPW